MRLRLASVRTAAVLAVAVIPATSLATTPTPSPSPTPTMTPTPMPAVELAVAAVSATTHDGNVPANTLDNNLATRWAGYGDFATITFDLGGLRQVAFVNIAVYRGNERRNQFDLELSSDGASWTPVLSSESGGTTTLEQTHDFPDRVARYVRYVGHGNVSNSGTVGLWNSLTEVSIYGATAAPTLTVTSSRSTLGVGESLVVTADSNLGIVRYSLQIYDASTNQPHDPNPLFTPVQPEPITVSRGPVSWTLTAVRRGPARFVATANGEIFDPACGCYIFRTVTASSPVVYVTDTVTPTPTPTRTPCPTPTAPPVFPPALSGTAADARVDLSWQSRMGAASHTYEVVRAVDDGPYQPLATVANAGATVTYTDTTVANGRRYSYWVRELWTWTYGTPPCPVETRVLPSGPSNIVTVVPGPGTPIEITPPASRVNATTNDGNLPGNTVDNNLASRWSGYGDGATLLFDLGAVRTVSHVRVAVYRGNERRNNFELLVSQDQMTWSRVFSGQSSGTTTAEQTYEFADLPGRYIRYVGHGNVTHTGVSGLWNSVSEVSVFGH